MDNKSFSIINNKIVTKKRKLSVGVLLLLLVITCVMFFVFIPSISAYAYSALPTLEEYEDIDPTNGFKMQEFITFTDLNNDLWSGGTFNKTLSQTTAYNVPIRIDTAYDLWAFSYYVNGRIAPGASDQNHDKAIYDYYANQTYFLGANIDYSKNTQGFLSIGRYQWEFKGKIFGQGFTISNLFYELANGQVTGSSYISFIAQGDGFTLENLGISYAVGNDLNHGPLDLVKASERSTQSNLSQKNVSGLVGYAEKATIRFCYVWANEEANKNNNSEFKITANITENNEAYPSNILTAVGLVTSLNNSNLEYIYFSGKITSQNSAFDKYVQPISYNVQGSTLKEVYYDSTKHSLASASSAYGEAVTTSNLVKKQNNSGTAILKYSDSNSRFGEDPITGSMFYDSFYSNASSLAAKGASEFVRPPMLRGVIKGSVIDNVNYKNYFFIRTPADLHFFGEQPASIPASEKSSHYFNAVYSLLNSLDMTVTYEKGYQTPIVYDGKVERLFSGSLIGTRIAGVTDKPITSYFLGDKSTRIQKFTTINQANSIVGLNIGTASYSATISASTSADGIKTTKMYTGLISNAYMYRIKNSTLATINDINFIGGGVDVESLVYNGTKENIEQYIGMLAGNITFEDNGLLTALNKISNIHFSGDITYQDSNDVIMLDTITSSNNDSYDLQTSLQGLYKPNIIGSKVYCGGIIGYINVSAMLGTISNLSFSGNIDSGYHRVITDNAKPSDATTTIEKTNILAAYVGGIFGYLLNYSGSTANGITLDNITNYGNVVGPYVHSAMTQWSEYHSVKFNNYVGGVAGYLNLYNKTYSYNGTNYYTGIYNQGNIYTLPVEFMDSNVQLPDVVNFVQSSKDAVITSFYAGGIAGQLFFGDITEFSTNHKIENNGTVYFIEARQSYIFNAIEYYGWYNVYLGGISGYTTYPSAYGNTYKVISGVTKNGKIEFVNRFVETAASGEASSIEGICYNLYYGGMFGGVETGNIQFKNVGLEYDININSLSAPSKGKFYDVVSPAVNNSYIYVHDVTINIYGYSNAGILEGSTIDWVINFNKDLPNRAAGYYSTSTNTNYNAIYNVYIMGFSSYAYLLNATYYFRNTVNNVVINIGNSTADYNIFTKTGGQENYYIMGYSKNIVVSPANFINNTNNYKLNFGNGNFNIKNKPTQSGTTTSSSMTIYKMGYAFAFGGGMTDCISNTDMSFNDWVFNCDNANFTINLSLAVIAYQVSTSVSVFNYKFTHTLDMGFRRIDFKSAKVVLIFSAVVEIASSGQTTTDAKITNNNTFYAQNLSSISQIFIYTSYLAKSTSSYNVTTRNFTNDVNYVYENIDCYFINIYHYGMTTRGYYGFYESLVNNGNITLNNITTTATSTSTTYMSKFYISGVVYSNMGTNLNFANYGNINITNVITENGQCFVNGISYTLEQYSSNVIRNMINYGNISIQGSKFIELQVSGLFYSINGSSSSLMQTNTLVNEGNISVSDTIVNSTTTARAMSISGIYHMASGVTATPTGIQVSNAYNFGDIDLYNVSSLVLYVGGIVSYRTGLLTNSINSGNINIINDSLLSANSNLGMSVGGVFGNTMSSYSVQNCSNIGNITIKEDKASTTTLTSYLSRNAVGGIGGHLPRGASVFSCVNYGDVTFLSSIAPYNPYIFVGGVIGYAGNTESSSSRVMTTLKDVINHGTVTLKSVDVLTGSVKNKAIGGILGAGTYWLEFDYAVNYGLVTGTFTNGGGIIGYVDETYSSGSSIPLTTTLESFSNMLYVYKTGSVLNIAGVTLAQKARLNAVEEKIGSTSGSDDLGFTSDYVNALPAVAKSIYAEDFFLRYDDESLKYGDVGYMEQSLVYTPYGNNITGLNWTTDLFLSGEKSTTGVNTKHLYVVSRYDERRYGRYLSKNSSFDSTALYLSATSKTKITSVIDYTLEVLAHLETELFDVILRETSSKSDNINALYSEDIDTGIRYIDYYITKDVFFVGKKDEPYIYKINSYKISDDCTMYNEAGTAISYSQLEWRIEGFDESIMAKFTVTNTVVLHNSTNNTKEKYVIRLTILARDWKEITVTAVYKNTSTLESNKLPITNIGSDTVFYKEDDYTWVYDYTADKYALFSTAVVSTATADSSKQSVAGFYIALQTKGFVEGAIITGGIKYDESTYVAVTDPDHVTGWNTSTDILMGTRAYHQMAVQRGENDQEILPDPGYIYVDLCFLYTANYTYYPPGGIYEYVITYTDIDDNECNIVFKFKKERNDQNGFTGYGYNSYIYIKSEPLGNDKLFFYYYDSQLVLNVQLPKTSSIDYLPTIATATMNINPPILYGKYNFNYLKQGADLTSLFANATQLLYMFNPHAFVSQIEDVTLDIDSSNTTQYRQYTVKFYIISESGYRKNYHIVINEAQPITKAKTIYKNNAQVSTGTITQTATTGTGAVTTGYKTEKNETSKYEIIYFTGLDRVGSKATPNNHIADSVKKIIIERESFSGWEDVSDQSDIPIVTFKKLTSLDGYADFINYLLVTIQFVPSTAGGAYRFTPYIEVPQISGGTIVGNGHIVSIPEIPDDSYTLNTLEIEKVASKRSYATHLYTKAVPSAIDFTYLKVNVPTYAGSINADNSITYVTEIRENATTGIGPIKKFYLTMVFKYDAESDDLAFFDYSTNVSFGVPDDATLWYSKDPANEPFVQIQKDISGNWIAPVIPENETYIFRVYAENRGYYTDYEVELAPENANKTIKITYVMDKAYDIYGGNISTVLSTYFLTGDINNSVKVTRNITFSFFKTVSMTEDAQNYYVDFTVRNAIGAYYSIFVDVPVGYTYTITAKEGTDTFFLLPNTAKNPFIDRYAIDVSSGAIVPHIIVTVKAIDPPWGLYDYDAV